MYMYVVDHVASQSVCRSQGRRSVASKRPSGLFAIRTIKLLLLCSISILQLRKLLNNKFEGTAVVQNARTILFYFEFLLEWKWLQKVGKPWYLMLKSAQENSNWIVMLISSPISGPASKIGSQPRKMWNLENEMTSSVSSSPSYLKT